MKSWWLSLLPVLVCSPCLAASLGVAGVLTGGLVAITGLLSTPVGLVLLLSAVAAAALGVVQVMRRHRSCGRVRPEGGRG